MPESNRRESDAAASVAMVVAAAMIANQVAGKATRDALFLSNFEVTALPFMLIGASFFSIAMVLAISRPMFRLSPQVLVPWAFAASGMLPSSSGGWHPLGPPWRRWRCICILPPSALF